MGVQYQLVDFQINDLQYKKTSWVLGIMDIITGELYYYSIKKFLSECNKTLRNGSYKFPTKIQGVKLELFAGEYNIKSLEVQYNPNITFIDTHDNHVIHYSGIPLSIRTRNGLERSFTHNLTTVYLNQMKIKTFDSGMKFFYNGILLNYKKGVGNRESGFNVERTINWKETNNRYFGGDFYFHCIDDTIVIENNLWPEKMTNDYFIKMLNQIDRIYQITGFYRMILPNCVSLSLRGLKLSNLVCIHELLHKSGSIKSIDFVDLDLTKVTDGLRIGNGNKKLELVDYSRAKGDIKSGYVGFFEVLGYNKDKAVIVLARKNQVNLCNALQQHKVVYLGDVKLDNKNMDTLDVIRAKIILLNKQHQGTFFFTVV